MKTMRRFTILGLSLLSLSMISCNRTQSNTGSMKGDSTTSNSTASNSTTSNSTNSDSTSNSTNSQTTKPSTSTTPTNKPSTPTVEKFTVTLTQVQGATLSIDHTDSQYQENDIVTVTLNITDSVLEFVFFQSEDGITFTDPTKDGNVVTTTFTMPKKNVTVTAVLKQKQNQNTYQIKRISNYSSDTFGSVSLKEGDTFKENDLVTMTVTKASSDFLAEYQQYYYIEIDGTMYHPTIQGENGYASSFSIDFTMPCHDVEIVLSYGLNAVDDAKGFNVTLEENQYVSLLAYDPAQKYTRFYGMLNRKAGYKVTSVKYRIGDGEWVDNIYSFDISNLCNLYIYGISGDVTIKVEGTFTGTKKIDYVNLDAVVPSSKLSRFYTEATEGDTYSMSFKASDAYTLKGKPTFEGVIVPDEDVTENYFKLTVGQSDITITFPATKNGKITLNQNDDLLSCKIMKGYTETEYCSPNATFKVYPVTKKGKVVTSARVIDEKGIPGSYCYPEENAEGVQFIELRMPAKGDCTVQVNTTDGISVTVKESEHGTLTLARDTYRKDDKVTFTFTTESAFYVFDKLVNAATNEEIASEVSGNYGTFTMPDIASLEVKALFKKAATATVTLEGFDSTTMESFNASGNKSKATLSSDKTSAEFLIGENISIYAYLKDSVKDATLKIYKTVNGMETEIQKGFLNYSLTVEEGLTKIRVEAKRKEETTKQAFKVTIVKPENVQITLKYNYQIVSSLDGLLVPNENGEARFMILDSIQGEEGHTYTVKVLDDKNQEIAGNKTMIATEYTVKSDITIKVTDNNA